MSAIKAIKSDPFSMVVIDLSLPVEPKLSLVKEVYHCQPDAHVITIEKEEYLKNTGALSSFSSVVSIDSIESFPDKLEAY
jgi:DNA-binding NtrC family response regulator